MKLKCSYTDSFGLTTSLSVSGVESVLQCGTEDPLSPGDNSAPEDLLRQSLPTIGQQLFEAHEKVAQALVCSSVFHLQKMNSELIPPIKNTSAPAGRNTPSGGCLVGTDDPSRG